MLFVEARVMTGTGSSFRFYFFYHVKNLGGVTSGNTFPKKRQKQRDFWKTGCVVMYMLVVHSELGRLEAEGRIRNLRPFITDLRMHKTLSKEEARWSSNPRILYTGGSQWILTSEVWEEVSGRHSFCENVSSLVLLGREFEDWGNTSPSFRLWRV